MTIPVDHLHNHEPCVTLHLLKHMHHTGSQENKVVTELEEPEAAVVQEAFEVEEQEEELQECSDHHPSSFEKGKP
jgi:hypothetical protein